MRPYSRIAFFISGHGFGHAVREVALIDALPREVEVFIFTSLDASFFADELSRPYRIIPCELDCGTLQSDLVDVDVEATLARYLALESGRSEAVAKYAPMLRSMGVDLVVADVPPLAFPIARAAGIESWAVYNFTWLDIYRPLVERAPRYRDMLRRMEEDYSLAGAHLRMYPALTPPPLAPLEDIGLVCRPGTPRREEFARRFGLDAGKRWATIYIGTFGLQGADWKRLAEFRDWEFLGLYPLPGAPGNYHVLRKDPSIRYADLTASCDLVVGKLGYGLVAGCLSLAKPVVFLGRRDFAEHEALQKAVEGRGLGLEVSHEAFLHLDVGEALSELPTRKVVPMPITGLARILEKMGFSPA